MPAVQATNCTFGLENMEQTDEDTMPGLYLDTNNPAPCGGELTEWSLCYYRVLARRQYQVELQVWRESTTNNEYTLVGSSAQTVTTRFLDDAFVCRRYSLLQSDSIPVQQGDIVGVYLEEHTRGNSALGVVATSNVQGSVLHHTEQVPSTLQLSELSRVDGVKMHISANIGMIR